MPSAPESLGRFVWYDLMTTDVEGAIRFYGDVVGWGTENWQGGEKPYTMWKAGDRPIGGVMDLPGEVNAPPHWIGYVGVPDIETTVRQAKELGGQVHHPPTDIPEIGRFAVIGDPQGAVIAIYTPSGEGMAPSGSPKAGDFSWHELATTNWEGAWDFYSTLFGWQKTDAMDMGEQGGVYQMFGTGGAPLGGMYDKTADMPGPPAWLYYARVPDIDAALQKVETNGGKVMTGPMEVPGGDRIAVCSDPQGGVFALHHTTRE